MTKTTKTTPYRVHGLLGGDDALRMVRAPQTTKTLSRMLIALFALVAIALVIVPWQQNAPAKGRVSAYTPVDRQQTIEAPVEGRVVRLFVQEGSRVKMGDPLVDLADNDPEILNRLAREQEALQKRIDAANERARAVDGRIGSLKASQRSALAAADQRVRMARERARAAEQSEDAAEAALKTARLNEDRQRGLFEKGLSSKRTMELAELDLARTETELQRASASLSAARAEVSALLSDQAKVLNDMMASINDAAATKASAEAEIASATAELARIEVRVARQTTQEVKAPRDGTVLRILARPGSEMLKSGEPLLIFVPDTKERAVEMWVSGNDVNLVTPGRQVRLQFEGWPAVQFSGWPSAAIGTYGGKVAFVDATDDGQGRFRVLVVPNESEAPWPSPEYLRQGTRVNGWILLNRVSLGYELWRQFNGFPPDWVASAAMGGEEESKKGKKGGDK